MRKDWLLLLSSVIITLCIAIGIIRLFAPRLLGVSPDLQLVKIDKKVPPFYENVFRSEDFKSQDYLIKDPITGVRAIPLLSDKYGGMGPNDLLGFRNRAIPNTAKIVIFGDSQTYGNNAVIEQNWPGFMSSELKSKGTSIYNMAVGGWAAPQYLNMFGKSMVFKPEAVVIAFYSGNDPLESFVQVYGNPYWQELIPDNSLKAEDAPKVIFPAPKEDQWTVTFKDGVKSVFTSSLRLTSNSDHPAAIAGYKIMARVAKEIAESVYDINVKLFFTIIPTKELVYAKKVAVEKLQAPEDYQTLVTREKTNLELLAKQIQSFPNANYVDVLKPLQQQAMQAVALYPDNENGHPIAAGYVVIGREIAKAVKPHVSNSRRNLPKSYRELVALQVSPGQFKYILVKDNNVYFFASFDVIEGNGWPPGDVRTVIKDEIEDLPVRGIITEVNPELYGPLKIMGSTGQ